MKRFAAALALVLWPAVLHAGPTKQILDHYADVALRLVELQLFDEEIVVRAGDVRSVGRCAGAAVVRRDLEAAFFDKCNKIVDTEALLSFFPLPTKAMISGSGLRGLRTIHKSSSGSDQSFIIQK